MGNRMKNIAGLFSQAKTRNIVLLTAVILVLVVGVGLLGLQKDNSEVASSSQLQNIPNVSAVTGLTEASPQVAEVQRSLNEQRYEQAQSGGKSAFPSLIGISGEQQSNQEGISAKDFAPQNQNTGVAAEGPQTGRNAQNQAALEEQLRAQQLAQAQASAQQQQLNQQAQYQDQQAREAAIQQAKQKVTQSMQNQAKAIMSSWAGAEGTPSQVYVEAQANKTEEGGVPTQSGGDKKNTTENGEEVAEEELLPATIKAGDIVYAVLNTAVNSDEPGPIMATIVGGEYKGAKLLGGLQQTKDIPGTNGPTALTLTFNTMSIPDQPRSITIDAVAIDPDTARTAVASDVDHHYLLRYGSLFASSFLQGYGNAITQSGQITINDPAGGSTEFKQQLNPQEELLAGLGEVGTRWGEQLDEVFDRPNTITVNSGVGLGILFLSDLTLPTGQ